MYAEKMNEDAMMSLTEAAREHGLHLSTLSRWISQGRLSFTAGTGSRSRTEIKMVKRHDMADIMKERGAEISTYQKRNKKARENKQCNVHGIPRETKWLTTTQASKIFEIAEASIWRYGELGKIDKVTTKETTLYNRFDIEAIIEDIQNKNEQLKGNIIPIPGPCITRDDGKEIFEKIKMRLANDLKVTVFIDDTVELIDPDFFDEAIGRLYQFLPAEKIRGNLKVEGLSEDDTAVLRTVIFLAKQNCKQPERRTA